VHDAVVYTIIGNAAEDSSGKRLQQAADGVHPSRILGECCGSRAHDVQPVHRAGSTRAGSPASLTRRVPTSVGRTELSR
jgi:hypothetical protein